MPDPCQLSFLEKSSITLFPLTLVVKKEDPGNYRLVTLTLICGYVMEQLILETISRDRKDRKIIKTSLRGFTKGISCLTDPDNLL